MARLGSLFLLAFLLAGGRADAVSAKDIIDLSRAGLGEAVLLALVEVDGGVFTIDNATLKQLKEAGVSERVIEAMVRSGRSRPAPIAEAPAVVEAEPVPPPPQVIVLEHATPVVQQVAVPVYVPVVSHVRTRGRAIKDPGGRLIAQPSGRLVQQPFGQLVQPPADQLHWFGMPATTFAPAQLQPKAPPPVYWGWGGKPRPDGWKTATPPDPGRRSP
jgi:hypothetical protein